MAIPFISNVISRNSFLIYNTYKTQAIELFGKDLAESLHNREHSWKKLMTSWNVFCEACAVIKSSNEYFSTTPKRIYCNLQSSDGLVFQTNRYTRHDTFETEGMLITPFGYFDIKFKNTQAIYQFIRNLQEKLYTKLLDDPYRNIKYSFTLSSNQEATLKSLYDLCGYKRINEIGEHAFTRSHVIEICNIIKCHLDMAIEELPISEQIPEPIRYISIGTQTDNAN